MNSSGDEKHAGGSAASFSLSPMDSSTDAGSPSPLSDASSPLPSCSVASMEGCREFYERRLQSLERFKRRVASYQQQPDMESQQQQQQQPTAVESVQYHQLQSDMMELMENDVNLMRQLMALGERIEELKALTLFAVSTSTSFSSSPHGISPTLSMISLDGVCCEEPVEHDENGNEQTVIASYEFPNPKSGSMSGVVSKTDNGHDDEPESGVDGEDGDLREEPTRVTVNGAVSCAPRVYFSRQNSILRIPIPPSRGFRSKTVADIQQHAIPGGVGGIVKRGHSIACETSSSDDAASCASHTLEKPRGAGWYARKKAGRDLVKSESILSSKRQNMRSNGKGANASATSIAPPYHASQSSCDSGVHHLNSSVDLLDEENLIYV